MPADDRRSGRGQRDGDSGVDDASCSTSSARSVTQRFAQALVAQDGRAARAVRGRAGHLALAPEAHEDEQDLERSRALDHEREAEAAPAGLGVAGEVVATPVDVRAQEEFGAGGFFLTVRGQGAP